MRGPSASVAAEMIVVGGLERDRDAARRKAGQALNSGKAADVFGRMISALGGPSDFLERSEQYLPVAPMKAAVPPPAPGFLAGVDARAIGNAIIELGGGRRRTTDKLDLSVGFTDVAPIGAEVDAQRPLAIVHAATEDAARQAIRNYQRACTISPSRAPSRAVVHETLT